MPLVYLGLWASRPATGRSVPASGRRHDELSSFVDTLGGFHQPANYAVLKLPGSLRQYLWQVREP